MVADNEYGWGPLLERIAQRYGVEPRNVVLAHGTSMANHLACAALVEEGDHVLIERPVYDPLVAVPRYLGCEIGFFERREEDGYSLDVARVEAAITPRTRLVILSNLHNPTGADKSRRPRIAGWSGRASRLPCFGRRSLSRMDLRNREGCRGPLSDKCLAEVRDDAESHEGIWARRAPRRLDSRRRRAGKADATAQRIVRQLDVSPGRAVGGANVRARKDFAGQATEARRSKPERGHEVHRIAVETLLGSARRWHGWVRAPRRRRCRRASRAIAGEGFARDAGAVLRRRRSLQDWIRDGGRSPRRRIETPCDCSFGELVRYCGLRISD